LSFADLEKQIEELKKDVENLKTKAAEGAEKNEIETKKMELKTKAKEIKDSLKDSATTLGGGIKDILDNRLESVLLAAEEGKLTAEAGRDLRAKLGDLTLNIIEALETLEEKTLYNEQKSKAAMLKVELYDHISRKLLQWAALEKKIADIEAEIEKIIEAEIEKIKAGEKVTPSGEGVTPPTPTVIPTPEAPTVTSEELALNITNEASKQEQEKKDYRSGNEFLADVLEKAGINIGKPENWLALEKMLDVLVKDGEAEKVEIKKELLTKDKLTSEEAEELEKLIVPGYIGIVNSVTRAAHGAVLKAYDIERDRIVIEHDPGRGLDLRNLFLRGWRSRWSNVKTDTIWRKQLMAVYKPLPPKETAVSAVANAKVDIAEDELSKEIYNKAYAVIGFDTVQGKNYDYVCAKFVSDVLRKTGVMIQTQTYVPSLETEILKKGKKLFDKNTEGTITKEGATENVKGGYIGIFSSKKATSKKHSTILAGYDENEDRICVIHDPGGGLGDVVKQECLYSREALLAIYRITSK